MKHTNKKRNDYESAYSFSSNIINTIHNGIRTKKILNLEYNSRDKGLTKREIEPMDIITKDGKTNLVGWCKLREDWRTFRIDRISYIAIEIQSTFVPKQDYDRANFTDEVQPTFTPRENNDTKKRQNKDYKFNASEVKTLSENKLKFDNEEIVNYSDDEDDLAL